MQVEELQKNCKRVSRHSSFKPSKIDAGNRAPLADRDASPGPGIEQFKSFSLDGDFFTIHDINMYGQFQPPACPVHQLIMYDLEHFSSRTVKSQTDRAAP